MFIAHIHQIVQKHSRLAFLLIGGVIIVPFVFLWNNPASMRSRFGGDKAGTIYGKAVSYGDLQAQRLAVNFNFFLTSGRWLNDGTMPKEYQAMVDQQAWHRLRELHVAHEQQLDAVNLDEVAQEIHTIFSKDGKFDQAFFDQVMKDQFSRQGIDGRTLDAIIRDNIVVSRLERLAIMGLPVSPAEVKQMFQTENTKFVADALSFNLDTFLTDPAAKPTLEQIAAFYKEKIAPNRDLLQNGKTPDELLREKIQQVRDAAPKGQEPDAAQLAQVESDIAQYVTPFYKPQEKMLRLALFPHAPFMAEAWKLVPEERVIAEYEQGKSTIYRDKPEEDAKTTIRERLVEIEVGKLVSKQAQAFGDDVYAAAEKTGKTGTEAIQLFLQQASAKSITMEGTAWFESGTPVPNHIGENALTNAARNLDAKGDISDAIRGATAHYIATLVDVKPGFIPQADDAGVQAKISEILTRQNALRLAQEKAAKVHAELSEKLKAGTPFAAASAGLDFKQQPAFSRRDPVATPYAMELSKATLGAKPNQLLEPVNTESGALLFFIGTVTPPDEKELANQQDALKSNLAQARQNAAASELRDRLTKESGTQFETGKP